MPLCRCRLAALLLALSSPCLAATPGPLKAFPPLPTPRPRVHLATFAGCASAGRLPAFVAEARRSGFFDEVRAWLPATLDSAWLELHGGRLTSSLRGCGYWSWKPEVVREALAAVPEGDVLVYADAGSSLHPENCGRFWQYVALAAAHPGRVLSFEMAGARAPTEASWSKADAGAALGVEVGSAHWASPQLHATYFFLVNCAAARELVGEWAAAAVAEGYHLIDDSPSRSPDPPSFIEHRHDQSLFSLLRKARGAALLLPDDAAKGSGPIQSTRCRTGREPACSLRLLKEALWVMARDRVPRLEGAADRLARRSCPRGAGRLWLGSHGVGGERGRTNAEAQNVTASE